VWDDVVAALRRNGWSVPDHLPPWSAARQVARRAADGAAGEALLELALVVSAVRWGGRDADEAMGEARALAERARDLR
jgi:hypothetical protein